MVTLYPEKLINIITNDALEDKLVDSFRKYWIVWSEKFIKVTI